MNFHFICRGNILRSVVAEAYLKSLGLKNVTAISSGTNVNWNDETERGYFADTIRLLDRHGIKRYVKDVPEQLTQQRIAAGSMVICMNQRVIDEAASIVTLPSNAINWNIVDIGEGHRTVRADKERYLEEIYKEITDKVDALVAHYDLR